MAKDAPTLPNRSRKKILFWSIAGALLCISLAGSVLLDKVTYEMFPLSYAESPRPTGDGSAVIVSASAIIESSAYMFVRDPARYRKPQKIGGPYASDGDRMSSALWSKDGSVLVVKADISANDDKGEFKHHGVLFTAAYDFRKHNPIRGDAPLTKSKAIARLLAERGGVGKVALNNPYSLTGDLGWWQARDFDLN